jgi:hypothetical protein
MHYLKSVILGLLGGFVIIGLLPFIAIIIIVAGFLGKINDGVK